MRPERYYGSSLLPSMLCVKCMHARSWSSLFSLNMHASHSQRRVPVLAKEIEGGARLVVATGDDDEDHANNWPLLSSPLLFSSLVAWPCIHISSSTRTYVRVHTWPSQAKHRWHCKFLFGLLWDENNIYCAKKQLKHRARWDGYTHAIALCCAERS